MANFVFLVFLFAGPQTVARACEYQEAMDTFFSCIRQWAYGGIYRDDPSAFLRDITVTGEICRKGSIASMQDCISTNVPVNCHSAHRYWRATRGKFKLICRHYREFKEEHKHCRVNEDVLQKHTRCTTENFNRLRHRHNFCLSAREYYECTKRAFGKHCTDKATKFFLKVLYTEMYPEAEHRDCQFDDIIAEIHSSDPIYSKINLEPQRLDEYNPKWGGDTSMSGRYNAMRSGVKSNNNPNTLSLCLTLYGSLYLYLSWF